MIILLLIVIVALGLFYEILQWNISGALKFALVVIEMLIVSQIFIKKYKMSSELGLVLLKSKKGIEIIDRIASRYETVFNFMADVGTSISYGLLSWGLMRKNISPVTLVIGLAILIFLSVYVAPLAVAFLMYAAGLGSVSKVAASSISGGVGGAEVWFWIVSAVLLIGGLFLFILLGIVYYGIVVFKALVTSLFFGTNAIANTAPGGDLLLPGINLPFFEGILALAIVMIVHEGAHAVLTRIGRVPLLSSGIVLFGVIPIGAFVEPDEKRLTKMQSDKQTRVLVAGPTANLLTSLAFFILFMSLFYGTTNMREGGLYIYSGLPSGTMVYQISGEPVDNINFSTLNLTKNTNITLLTNHGEIVRQTDDKGKIGITFTQFGSDTIFSRYENPALEFIYMTLGLCVALNFVVGTVNILPIPLFDGYRIIDINIKNKMLVKAVSYGALFFFILNFLPRFFH